MTKHDFVTAYTLNRARAGLGWEVMNGESLALEAMSTWETISEHAPEAASDLREGAGRCRQRSNRERNNVAPTSMLHCNKTSVANPLCCSATRDPIPYKFLNSGEFMA